MALAYGFVLSFVLCFWTERGSPDEWLLPLCLRWAYFLLGLWPVHRSIVIVCVLVERGTACGGNGKVACASVLNGRRLHLPYN